MQRDWQSILVRLAVALAALLVVLAALALLYIFFGVLQRFGGVLVLFVVGALVAYVLDPAVNRATTMTGKRWAGIVIVYAALAVILLLVGVLVFQPLVSQSSALVSALNRPSARSLTVLNRIAGESGVLVSELRAQRLEIVGGQQVPAAQQRDVRSGIAQLQAEIAALQDRASITKLYSAAGRSTSLAVQLHIPPSYLRPLEQDIAALARTYPTTLPAGRTRALTVLNRSIADAAATTRQVRTLHRTVLTTPILLLDAQTWADQHHIDINIQSSAGQVVKKLTGQTSSLLTNTAAVLTGTATLLFDLSLSLIISVYVVSDGGRLIDEAIQLVPDAYRERARRALSSVNDILGGYIRGQLLLALLAGVLAGIGAAVLGVPYPVVIGVGTFLLQPIPVIGPTLVYFPAAIISLLFTSLQTTLILMAYFIVFEQVISNVIGPRVTGKSAGISPLEAMAAALIGYPIGGILGAFLAVPLVGILHVVIKEAWDAWGAHEAKQHLSSGGSTDGTESGSDSATGHPTAQIDNEPVSSAS